MGEREPDVLDGLWQMPAVQHGNPFRKWTVRVVLSDGRHIGLATTAYSYSLTVAQRVEATKRLAAMWSLLRRIPTSELERLVQEGRTIRLVGSE